MAGLSVGMLVQHAGQSHPERLLWLEHGGDRAFVIDIVSAKALPALRSIGALTDLLASGECAVCTTDPWSNLGGFEENIPKAHRDRRDRCWALIRPLVFDQPGIFTEAGRGRAIERVMAATGTNKVTLYRLLRRYWQRGQTPNALLPDYARCGGAGRDKAVTTARRGRPPSVNRGVLNVTPEMRRLFRSVIAGRFARNQAMSLGGCYEELIKDYYSDRVLDERTGHQIRILHAERPSPRQFSYWFQKDNDVFDVERKRRTPRVYDKDMRALLGTSAGETSGPGSRYQIDATIGDVYLVSRYDRRKIVGRPVIYVVVDVFSHMIVGLHVGFEGPSWLGAMQAVSNAVSEKISYCRRFGIEIEDTDWPCHGLPQVLLGDRGEMAGGMVETLINNFSLTVENTAPYRADWKGLVEQQFRLLPAKFKAYVPGYIQADYQERGGSDYRLDATLDIDQITRIIILCILQYNNLHRLDRYQRAADLIADDVQPIPIELWEWGITRRSGRLRTCAPELLRLRGRFRSS